MELKRIDHIGVVVDDLDRAERLLADGFGMRAGKEVTRDDVWVRFYRCGDVSIELIQLRDPAAQRARLEDGAAARIEHIAIEVDDLQRTLTALRALGVEPTAPPRKSSSGMTVSTKPATSAGVMFQFLQRDAAAPAA